MTTVRDQQVDRYTVIPRAGRVYLVDHHPDADPGMSTVLARRLAVELCTAADVADGHFPTKEHP